MNPTILRLKEFEERQLEPEELSAQAAEILWEEHSKHLDLDPPSGKNQNKWVLRPKGYVGLIPVDASLQIVIEPKVPIENVFRMLEYAYRADIFGVGASVQVESISDLFESLARILVQAHAGSHPEGSPPPLRGTAGTSPVRAWSYGPKEPGTNKLRSAGPLPLRRTHSGPRG